MVAAQGKPGGGKRSGVLVPNPPITRDQPMRAPEAERETLMRFAETEKRRRCVILALLGPERVADMESLVGPYEALPDHKNGIEFEWKSGVKVLQLHWGFYFEGRRDTLVANGVGSIEWYPDGTERDGHRIRRTKRLWLLDGSLVEVRMKTRQRYWIMVDLTSDAKAVHSKRLRCNQYTAARRAARKDQAFRAWLRALLKTVRAMPIDPRLTK